MDKYSIINCVDEDKTHIALREEMSKEPLQFFDELVISGKISLVGSLRDKSVEL